jgi:phage-related protein
LLGILESAVEQIIEDGTEIVDEVLVAVLSDNLAGIIDAVTNATETIVSVTIDAVGGVLAGAAGLTQAQINQLTAAIQTLLDAISQIEATLEITSGLPEAVLELLQDEVDELESIIGPLVLPLARFIAAIRVTTLFGITANITGLNTVASALGTVLQGLVASLGLEGLAPIIAILLP